MFTAKHKWLDISGRPVRTVGVQCSSRLKMFGNVFAIILLQVLSHSMVNCFANCPSSQLISTLVTQTDSEPKCECSQIQEGGWEITCYSESVHTQLSDDYQIVPYAFFIRYEIGRQVKITCDSGVPSFKPALFQGFGIELIDAFSLENCPLPQSLALSVILHRTSSVSSIHAKTQKSSSEPLVTGETHNALDSGSSPEISKVRSLSITAKNPVSLQQLSDLLAGLEPLEQLKLSQFMITDFANITASEASGPTNDTIVDNRVNSTSLFDENLFKFAENFPNLEILILQSFITESVPGVLFHMLSDLSKLSYLELDSNHLQSLPKATFAYASNTLEKLYLYHNQISTLDSNAFANLSQLQILDLSHNRLHDLPQDLLKDLKSLNYLSIKNNLLSKLPENLFRHNTKLISLDLSSNRDLKTFPSNLLKGMQSLTNFTAEDCHLTRLSKNAQTFFRNAPNLESVRVRGNLLTNLTVNGLFGGNSKLRKLDFSYNNISSISRDIFSSNSSQINELNLYGNEIEVLPDNIFAKLRNLRYLNLGFNQLRQTDPQLFLPLQNLEELNLSKNTLVTINSKQTRIPFGLGNMLRKVTLANNRLSDFDSDFNSINWSLYLNIAELDLRNNSFKGRLRVPVFSSSIAPIINLDLSHNRFTSIDIQDVINYDKLSLDYNHSEVSPSDGTRRTRDSNSIKTNIYETHVRLDNNPISCDCFLEPFLSYVKKSHLTYQSRSSANTYRKSIFLTESEDLVCDRPDHLKGQTLDRLELVELICPIEDRKICPANCQCAYQSTDRTAVIDCDDRRLTSLPQELELSRFYNISLENNSSARIESVSGVVVQLRNNLIEQIENINRMFIWSNKLMKKPSFVDIYLDNNSISSVHEDIIPQFYPFKNSSLPLIRVLSLRDNRIQSLPLTVLNNFDSFASHLSDNSIAEPKLYLGNNPYNCHNEKALPGSVCQIRDFKLWLTRHHQRIGDLDAVRCDAIAYNSSSTIIEIPDQVLCPILETAQNETLLLALTITCIILAISLFVVSVLYYRNKQTILAFIYIHFNPIFICLSFSEDDLDEDKVYDAFVSYSSADRDVVMSLIEKLERPNNEANMILHNTTGASIHEGLSDQIIPENEFKKSQMNLSTNNHNLSPNGAENSDPNNEQYYKLCIHERDWLPGNLISWNIVNSVQNSKRTILVLSKDFIESIWFQVEFHTAYYQMLEDKIDRLIVVVRGQLPPKEQLDKDLVFLLTTKTYLVWGEKWFWEKLRYALPHKKISNNLKSFEVKSTKSVKPIAIQSNGVTNSVKNANKNNTNNKSSEVMKDYVDKTIANHFQLNSYSNPTNNSKSVPNSAKSGPKSLRNSSSVTTPSDSRLKNSFENQSFVIESHT